MIVNLKFHHSLLFYIISTALFEFNVLVDYIRLLAFHYICYHYTNKFKKFFLESCLLCVTVFPLHKNELNLIPSFFV